MAEVKTDLVKPEEKNQKKTAEVFDKQQLTAAKRYRKRRDLLEALLEDGKTYTLADTDKIINEYLKQEVK